VEKPGAEGSSLVCVSMRASKQHLLVRIPPSDDTIPDITRRILEALRWLCEANRKPEDDDSEHITASSLEQAFSISIDDGTALHAYSITSRRVPPEEHEPGSCWRALFKSAFVVSRPVQRTWGTGLELCFGLMTRLASVQNYLWREDDEKGGYIMVGFYTALIPKIRNPVDGTIQWHLEFTTDSCMNEDHLSQALSQPYFKVESLDAFDDMRDTKCFLGWSGNANVLLGTRRMTFDVVWTSLEHQARTMHKKGVNTVVQAGVTAGVIQAVVQIGGNWEFASNRQRWEPSRDYATAITDASQRVALVFDVQAQRGWLVPKLSLLLHLCHVYFHHVNRSSAGDPIPFALPGPDGAEAAKAAFTNQGDLAVFRIGDNDVVALRNVVVDLSIGLVNSAKTREDPRKLLVPVFYGSELKDIVDKPSVGSDLRKVPVSKAAQGWLPMIGKIDFIGVCGNLGLAIEPATKGNCSCQTLPAGRGYLAAHLWCLDIMLRRSGQQGISDLQHSVVKLGDGEWSFKPHQPCPHATQPGYWEAPQAILQCITGLGIFGTGCASPSATGAPLLTGAVVFGRLQASRKGPNRREGWFDCFPTKGSQE